MYDIFMKKTILTILCALLLIGCGQQLSGSYKMENVMPKMQGSPFPVALSAQMNSVMDSQRGVLEFGPGRKVTIKQMGMGTEATYKISGSTLKIMTAQNVFIEYTIDGDTLIGPYGIKYVKQ